MIDDAEIAASDARSPRREAALAELERKSKRCEKLRKLAQLELGDGREARLPGTAGRRAGSCAASRDSGPKIAEWTRAAEKAAKAADDGGHAGDACPRVEAVARLAAPKSTAVAGAGKADKAHAQA